MLLKVIARSDMGCVRTNNEDHILAGNFVFSDSNSEFEWVDKPVMLAVADGMGGHNGGEVASKMVLESLKKFSAKMDEDVNPEEFCLKMEAWLQRVNKSLRNKGSKEPSLRGMGTTLAGIYVSGNNFYIFHAGDSRIYTFSNGLLTRLTHDHTQTNPHEPNKRTNLLVNCIGPVEKPWLEIKDASPFFIHGSKIMICTDGLTDMITETEIARYLGTFQIHEMVKRARRQGGRDNISVIGIDIF